MVGESWGRLGNEVGDIESWMGLRKRDLGVQGILANITVNGVADVSGKLRVSKQVQ